jgi:AAA domain-containing protein
MLREVHLPGAIHLVQGKKFNEGLVRRREPTGLPAGVDQIVRDLTVRPDGAAAVVTEWKGGYGLRLHTYAYAVDLTPSEKRDFFWVNKADPFGFSHHAALTRCSLLLRCRWRVAARPREVAQDASVHWDKLYNEWTRLEQELADLDAVARLKPEHAQYLDLLTTFNEIARAADQNQPRGNGFAYQKVTPVGDPGFTSTSTYAFHIVGRSPERRSYVQIGGDGERRGQVQRVADGAATVRFDKPLDYGRLPQQGELVPARVDTVHAKRRESVEALRTRQTRHRSMLDVLVGGQVSPIPPTQAQSAQPLDPEQLTAFRKMLRVEDMMVVLGPPGTGKTRVITEVAGALGRSERGKILITSHSHKAVDNVLARMPAEVVMLRIGKEIDVSPDVRSNLLEVYAADLRGEVVERSRRKAEQYTVLPTARRWHTELGGRIQWWRSARTERESCAAELARCRRAADGPAHDRVDDLSERVRRLEKRSTRAQARLDRLSRRGEHIGMRLLPSIFGRLRDYQLANRQERAAQCSRALAQARDALRIVADELEASVGKVPQVQAAQRKLDEANENCSRLRGQSLDAMTALRNALLSIELLPEVHDIDDESMLQWLDEVHSELQTQFELLNARAKLVDDWHAEVSSSPTQQLHPELIRYADVIGATCIGSASNEEIAAEEFDLVIADEAGQIKTSDVLIPLIRGRRAVLVGDDMQLPPVAEPHVEQAINGRDKEEALLTLSRKSLLETMVAALPASNIVQLRTQRRMPEVIAGFVSDHFYRATLRSEVSPPRGDALFRSPLAFVDTSSLPVQDRRERRVQGKEAGYVNSAEARLLNRLAEHYQRSGAEWALIVPYRAQLEHLKEMALEWAPNQEAVDANMGTVDSFQGGERDVVLYGFTRSNPGGRIGFLDDLRRMNVAFTRAKQRLVLVGDLNTLRDAEDEEFRELMDSLHIRLRASGELCTHPEIIARLTELGS